MPLKLYKKKRDFSITPEPKAKVSNRHKYLYVVQKHAASHLHYDFRLELNGELLSWAVPKGPCLDPSIKRLAVEVEPHPVSYGHFEGLIPKGQYGGGTVLLWDVGKWIPTDENPYQAYKKGHLRFTLKGKKLKGGFSLIRLKDGKSWLLIKTEDKYAKPLSDYDILEKKPKSILSNLTLEKLTDKLTKEKNKSKGAGGGKKIIKKRAINIAFDLPASSMPKHIKPQLATLVDAAPNTEEWLHELKFDGYRMLAFKSGRIVRLVTRNNNDWTDTFKNVAKEVSRLNIKNCILDGEIVFLDKNNQSNFQLLQNAIKKPTLQKFIYYIFDIIYYDQFNLKSTPLIERKKILSLFISENSNQVLRFSSYVIGSGDEIFSQSCRMGMEGIVSKLLVSPYEEKRTKTWRKVKCVKRQEFVIGGYTKPQGGRGYFGSLFLGVYDKKKQLVFCGNVGTGFTEASLKDIYKKLKENQAAKNPFTTRPPGVTSAMWVKPVLVCEVEFTEWTSDGRLRHPSFKGLRSDKPAKQIKREDK